MATVTIDISEYDMLRNGKEQAEAEVKSLKKDIKGLKDKSRVITTTIIKKKSDDIWGDICGSGSELKTISTSTQLTGFDDIELMVREKLTKDVQADLDHEREFLERTRKMYEQERTTLKSEFEEEYNKKEKKLYENLNQKEKESNEKIEELSQKVQVYFDKIQEYQKKFAEIYKIPNWIRKLFGVKLQNLTLS